MDIATLTKISTAHLVAIEAEDFHALPAVVYVRGFVQQVAKHLELDPTQAEVIINATSVGRLSLVLRPIVDATVSTDADAVNEAIRMSSPFLTSGGQQQGDE